MCENNRIIHVDPFLYLYGAILFLTIPIKWLFSFLLCYATHELSHIICAKLLGMPISEIEVGMHGANIKMRTTYCWQELLCACAGPLGGLLPVLFYKQVPEAGLCSLLITLYNLLPIYPSDGARFLHCALRLLTTDSIANFIVGNLTLLFQAIIVFGCIYCSVCLRMGIFPLVIAMIFLIGRKKEKMP